MSSKSSFSQRISRPFKLQSKSSKALKVSPTSPGTPATSKRSQRPIEHKSKPSAGRRLLNIFKKGVPCTSSSKAHAEESEVDDYLDVIDISPRFNEESFSAASPPPSPEIVNPAHISEVEGVCSPSTPSPPVSSSSSVESTSTSTPKSSVRKFLAGHKGDSMKPSPRQLEIACSLETPFATHGDSFYQMPYLNDAPTTAHIHRLSIYGCPSSGNDTTTPRIEHKAPEAFLRAYPINIYDASINVVPTTTKVAPAVEAATAVDSTQVTEPAASPVYVVVKCEQRNEPEFSKPIPLRCFFPTLRIITIPKYTMEDGEVIFKKRRRFKGYYKHLQTLTAIEEEDEGVEDDSSSAESSESESVHSLLQEDSCTPPISVTVKDLECEEVEEEDQLAVDIDVPRSEYQRRKMTRRAGVYGKDQLVARSYSLMTTATRPPVGLRPLLLPVHLALRDAAIHGRRVQ